MSLPDRKELRWSTPWHYCAQKHSVTPSHIVFIHIKHTHMWIHKHMEAQSFKRHSSEKIAEFFDSTAAGRWSPFFGFSCFYDPDSEIMSLFTCTHRGLNRWKRLKAEQKQNKDVWERYSCCLQAQRFAAEEEHTKKYYLTLSCVVFWSILLSSALLSPYTKGRILHEVKLPIKGTLYRLEINLCLCSTPVTVHILPNHCCYSV